MTGPFLLPQLGDTMPSGQRMAQGIKAGIFGGDVCNQFPITLGVFYWASCYQGRGHIKCLCWPEWPQTGESHLSQAMKSFKDSVTFLSSSFSPRRE